MTLRLRLTLYWAAVLTLLLTIAGVAVFVLFARGQWAQLDGALLEEAATAADTIHRMSPEAAGDVVRDLSAERDLGPARRVQVLVEGRVVADAGDARADLPLDDKVPAGGAVVEGRRRRFRYALIPVQLDVGPGCLIDGVDATPIRLSIYRLEKNLLVIIPLLLVSSVGGGLWLAGRALAPMAAMTAALAAIAPRDLARRLDIGPVDDEVARLSRAINAMLERVEGAALSERRFAADAAHELRTPLAVLRTGLEVTLGRERSGTEYADSVAAALRDTVALCRIADQLLALARLDHETALARVPLNLGDLAQEVADAVEPLAQAKGTELVTSLDEVTVNGNRDHLRRLIVNLLDNALKFTPEGGQVALTLEADGGAARLCVADNGPGIATEDLPRVFDRFFRGKERNESGSGLGLSLCREIARLHGGEISAANRSSGGAAIVVTLPLA